MTQMLTPFLNCAPIRRKEQHMSRFKKLAHVLWHCQYHIVWVPKYRYRVLTGRIGDEVKRSICQQVARLECRLVELNI